MDEKVNKMGEVLKRGLTDSDHRRYYAYWSGMNKTSRRIELGAHFSHEGTGDTGTNVMVQEIMDLKIKPI